MTQVGGADPTFSVRSLGGAIAMLSLVLYPYVYLLARTAFLEQSVCALEVSRTLGCSAWGSFHRVALPLARPFRSRSGDDKNGPIFYYRGGGKKELTGSPARLIEVHILWEANPSYHNIIFLLDGYFIQPFGSFD